MIETLFFGQQLDLKYFIAQRIVCDGVLRNPTMWSMDDEGNENFD